MGKEASVKECQVGGTRFEDAPSLGPLFPSSFHKHACGGKGLSILRLARFFLTLSRFSLRRSTSNLRKRPIVGTHRGRRTPPAAPSSTSPASNPLRPRLFPPSATRTPPQGVVPPPSPPGHGEETPLVRPSTLLFSLLFVFLFSPGLTRS